MTVRITIAVEEKLQGIVGRRYEDLITRAKRTVDKIKDSSKVEYLKGQGRPTRKVKDSPEDSLEDLKEQGRPSTRSKTTLRSHSLLWLWRDRLLRSRESHSLSSLKNRR